MYPPRLYKYQDSSVLYTPTVQLFGYLLLTHTLLAQTHTHDVSAPCLNSPSNKPKSLKLLTWHNNSKKHCFDTGKYEFNSI